MGLKTNPEWYPFFKSKGYDPEKFYYDQKTKQFHEFPGELETFLRTGTSEMFPAVGAAGAMGLGAATLGGLGTMTPAPQIFGPIGAAVGGLGGAIGGHALVSKAQNYLADKFFPDETGYWNQRQQMGSEMHPKSALAGGAVAQLTGFKPTAANIKLIRKVLTPGPLSTADKVHTGILGGMTAYGGARQAMYDKENTGEVDLGNAALASLPFLALGGPRKVPASIARGIVSKLPETDNRYMRGFSDILKSSVQTHNDPIKEGSSRRRGGVQVNEPFQKYRNTKLFRVMDEEGILERQGIVDDQGITDFRAKKNHRKLYEIEKDMAELENDMRTRPLEEQKVVDKEKMDRLVKERDDMVDYTFITEYFRDRSPEFAGVKPDKADPTVRPAMHDRASEMRRIRKREAAMAGIERDAANKIIQALREAQGKTATGDSIPEVKEPAPAPAQPEAPTPEVAELQAKQRELAAIEEQRRVQAEEDALADAEAIQERMMEKDDKGLKWQEGDEPSYVDKEALAAKEAAIESARVKYGDEQAELVRKAWEEKVSKERPTYGWLEFWERFAMQNHATRARREAVLPRNRAGGAAYEAREILISLRNAGVDTPPHELWHNVRDDVMTYGTEAEKRFITELEAHFGSEEAASQTVGRAILERVEPGGDKFLKDAVDFLNWKLKRATPSAMRRMAANMVFRGRGADMVPKDIKDKFFKDWGFLPKTATTTPDEKKEGPTKFQDSDELPDFLDDLYTEPPKDSLAMSIGRNMTASDIVQKRETFEINDMVYKYVPGQKTYVKYSSKEPNPFKAVPVSDEEAINALSTKVRLEDHLIETGSNAREVEKSFKASKGEFMKNQEGDEIPMKLELDPGEEPIYNIRPDLYQVYRRKLAGDYSEYPGTKFTHGDTEYTSTTDPADFKKTLYFATTGNTKRQISKEELTRAVLEANPPDFEGFVKHYVRMVKDPKRQEEWAQQAPADSLTEMEIKSMRYAWARKLQEEGVEDLPGALKSLTKQVRKEEAEAEKRSKPYMKNQEGDEHPGEGPPPEKMPEYKGPELKVTDPEYFRTTLKAVQVDMADRDIPNGKPFRGRDGLRYVKLDDDKFFVQHKDGVWHVTTLDDFADKIQTNNKLLIKKVQDEIKAREELTGLERPLDKPSWKNQEGNEPVTYIKSDVDQLEAKGGDYAVLGNAIKEASHTAREKTGRWVNPILKPKLSKDEQKAVVAHGLREEETGRIAPYTGSAEGAEAYSAIRQGLREVGAERRAAGLTIAGRPAGLDPSYFPRQLSLEKMDQLRGEHDAAWHGLKNEFFAYNARRGVTLDKVERAWKARIGSLEDDANILPYFKALREAEGVKIPDSWVSTDLEQSMSRYFSNAAKDLEWFKQVETPHRNLIEGEDSIAGNSRVRSAFEGYVHGMSAPRPGMRRLRGVSRIAGALLLTNPLNRTLDAATTPFKLAPFVNILELPGFLASARNFRKGVEASFRQGTLRRNNNLARQLLDADHAFMDRTARQITKKTGTELIERQARGLAQSMGEYVAQRNVIRARAGDRSAIKFLNEVSKDWDNIANSPEGIEKLGARIGQIAQGAYDATNLPAWMRNSEAQLLFPFMKWNIEQTNNFRKFVIKGGPKTMIASLLSAVLGGVLFKEIREALTGNKSYDANLDEILAGDDLFRQVVASGSSVASLMQQTGLMGVVPLLSKMTLDMYQGRPNEPFRNLALNAGVSTARHLNAAIDAIANGEPIEKVLGSFTANIAKENSGLGRFIAQQVEDPADKVLKNKRRDFHVYQFLHGEPILPLVSKPSYRGYSEREFDKATPAEARKILRPLVSEIRQSPMNRYDKARELRKLRTPGGAPTAPSINNQWAWNQWVRSLRKTDPENANRLIFEERRRQRDQARKRKMVPQIRVR